MAILNVNLAQLVFSLKISPCTHYKHMHSLWRDYLSIYSFGLGISDVFTPALLLCNVSVPMNTIFNTFKAS